MDSHDQLNIAISVAIGRARLKANLSQQDLADITGLHRSYIGDLERGRRSVALANLSKLAQGLGVPASRLMKDAEALVASNAAKIHAVGTTLKPGPKKGKKSPSRKAK